MIRLRLQAGSMPLAPAALRAAGLVALLVLGGGCATVEPAPGSPGQRLDPWENWNRKVFDFNESLDRAVLFPVATAYSKAVPQPVRTGVTSFYGNFMDAWSAVNSLLQGQVVDGFQDAMRVATNTFFGVFGLMDVASEMGIESSNQDFGHTLARWGFGSGPYMVLPILGPSTVRETIGLPLDFAVSPSLFINDFGVQVAVTSLRLVNQRSTLLGATKLLDDIALDKYLFVRDAYLQRRGVMLFAPDAGDSGADEPPPAGPAGPAASAASAASAVAPVANPAVPATAP